MTNPVQITAVQTHPVHNYADSPSEESKNEGELETPQGIGKLCTEIADGKYWHHGLAFCLNKWFENLATDITISININIDSLPIHKSSKFQIWPILCNIHEMPELQPDLESFLEKVILQT